MSSSKDGHAVVALIEQAMIFALGFLVSGLLALLVLPAFWRRAMRLSMRRLEMLMPLSMTEAVAERDQLRAQAAVEQRRLERKIDAMTQDRARHMSEIGRRAGIIADLEDDLAVAENALRAKEAELRQAWAELGAAQIDMHDMTARLRVIDVEFDALIATEQQLRYNFDEQRLEKAALQTRIESFRLQDHDLRQRLKAALLDREEHIELAQRLADERDHLRKELQTAAAWREQLTAGVTEHLARIEQLEQGERLERRGRLRAEKELDIANKLLAAAEAAMAMRAPVPHVGPDPAWETRASNEAAPAHALSHDAARPSNGYDATSHIEDLSYPQATPPGEGDADFHAPHPMPERHIAAS